MGSSLLLIDLILRRSNQMFSMVRQQRYSNIHWIFTCLTIRSRRGCRNIYIKSNSKVVVNSPADESRCVASSDYSKSGTAELRSRSRSTCSSISSINVNNVDRSMSRSIIRNSLTLFGSTVWTNHIRCHHDDAKSRKCWKCGRDTHPDHELFFCGCGVVQKPAEQLTYYDLFQLKQTYDLDLQTLGKHYRSTQSRLHPDKFSTKPHQEQAFAEEQSVLLNKAYNTLMKPLSRAIYMLELNNITIEENDGYSDPDFLMDIMTINEQISTASSAKEIDRLDEMNEEKVRESVKLISDFFQNGKITEAKIVTIKLRYYTTIQERIKDLRMKNLG